MHVCAAFASIFAIFTFAQHVVSKPEKDYDSQMGRFFCSVADEALNPNLAHQILDGTNGSYRIESMIAKGGMGATVYLAKGSSGDRVALKLLPVASIFAPHACWRSGWYGRVHGTGTAYR